MKYLTKEQVKNRWVLVLATAISYPKTRAPLCVTTEIKTEKSATKDIKFFHKCVSYKVGLLFFNCLNLSVFVTFYCNLQAHSTIYRKNALVLKFYCNFFSLRFIAT